MSAKPEPRVRPETERSVDASGIGRIIVAVGWLCDEGEHLRRVPWQRHTVLSKPWCDLCFRAYRLVEVPSDTVVITDEPPAELNDGEA